jgi:nucleoid-associated protein YgaU
MTMNARRGRGWVIVVLVVGIALTVTGCAKKKAIQAVEDMNRAFGEAKDACASVYAASETATVQTDVDATNVLSDDKKWKKALEGATGTMPKIQNLHTVADQQREQAQREANEALAAAETALKEADESEAAKYGGSYYADGKSKLEQARKQAGDPCAWKDATAAAKQAEDALRRARNAAIAEKKRLEEEAAAAARAKAEEEARRKAAEQPVAETLPGNYQVQRGDYLWRIAGMDKIYQGSKFWPLIYDANRSQIQNPDLIYPGQNLTIPRKMSDTEMMSKLRTMWSKAARGEAL